MCKLGCHAHLEASSHHYQVQFYTDKRDTLHRGIGLGGRSKETGTGKRQELCTDIPILRRQIEEMAPVLVGLGHECTDPSGLLPQTDSLTHVNMCLNGSGVVGAICNYTAYASFFPM